MPRRRPTEEEVEILRAILDFQFGEGAGEALLPPGSDIEVEVTGKGRIRYVLHSGERILTLRPNDGLFSLSLEAAERLLHAFPPPRLRVVIRGDRDLTGSVLVGDVVDMDPDLRPGDEVIVVDRKDKILAVGRLRLPKAVLEGLDRGEVVRIRKRVKSSGGV
ncbi:MAG: tRNA-guanine transglycosylase [Desulfurococcales archaeon]|nr:tRNA-guanine transglycosylase [Desulfurococcales archaeon]